MKFIRIILAVSIIVIGCSGNVNADSSKLCSNSYKACISKLLDSYSEYSKSYDKNPIKCNNNIKEWSKSDYDFVHCQIEYNHCRGKEGGLWDRINSSTELNLKIGRSDSHGLSVDEVDMLLDSIKNIPNLQSLLVSHKGDLMYETYHAFKDELKPQRINSITKSIVSLLVRIAIDKGYIESEDLPIKPYFKEYYSNNKKERKELITIKHALVMTTGINFSDQTYYFNDGEKWNQFLRDDNAYDWILEKEMLMSYKPGDTWMYNSMNVDLLSSIIYAETGMTTLEFAKQYLFDPLGIENYLWLHDSNGYYYGGFGLYLRPRALIRIGEMVLNNGMYEGEKIVSEQWINKSHYHHYPLGGEEGWEYGYLWWKHRMDNKQVISALGYAGQIIALVPSLDLVIVTTADSNVCGAKEEYEQFWAAMNLVEDVIRKIDN